MAKKKKRKAIPVESNKDWLQIFIAFYISGIIAYLIVVHTGIKTGQIKPDLVYTFFTGVFATKIVDFAYKKYIKN